jgi:hypothetical protein
MIEAHGGAEGMSTQCQKESQFHIDDPAEQLRSILIRAKGGDKAVLPELREALDRYPEIWQTVGDLGKTVENMLLAAIAKVDLATQESIRRHAERLRGELRGPAPSPLEKLLVDRLLADWLATYTFDVLTTQELSLAQDPFGLVREGNTKRHESAHHRLLRSAKMLAEVRRLLGGASSSKQEPEATRWSPARERA